MLRKSFQCVCIINKIFFTLKITITNIVLFTEYYLSLLFMSEFIKKNIVRSTKRIKKFMFIVQNSLCSLLPDSILLLLLKFIYNDSFAIGLWEHISI